MVGRTKASAALLFVGAATVGIALAAHAAPLSNLPIVREAFRKWNAGQGSLFDLMADDALIVIPGTARHCGTFSKGDFVTNVATPFIARFSNPPVPRPSKYWSDGEDVAVLADAQGRTRDGTPYKNSYVFVLKMKNGRIVRATEFLDMAAFNDVWDRVEMAPAPSENSGESE